ncbi:MAG: dethiobiotin synthase [Verrucomicrobia bacterium]|nr:MAG: dethiobiotin synthase [Verrucomicrobiota bacterium]
MPKNVDVIMPSSGRGVFITGTDTGVGKTAVTAALLAVLRQRGVDAVPMKPVQTGCTKRAGKLVAPDLEFCLRNAGLAPAEELCVYRFAPASSPHLAALLARRPIQLHKIASAFRRLAMRHDFVLVEGAGGTLVPLGGGRTMCDLMCALALPVVVVARPGLGTINHTLLTLAALRAARLKIAGVFFVHTQPGPLTALERDNATTIAQLGRVAILGRLPFIAKKSDFGAAVRRFSKSWKIEPPDFPSLGKSACAKAAADT